MKTLIGLLALTISSASFAGSDFSKLVMKDQFSQLSDKKWSKQTHTFHCNDTSFNKQNVSVENGNLVLKIDDTATSERSLSGAEVMYSGVGHKGKTDNNMHYGRYEIRTKSTNVPGAVSSIFLYRRDPWQEIDIEFLGRDPRMIQFNVFYNSGKEGDKNNEAIMDPVRLPLPFDASADFHDYAIEWSPGEIRWYVDGQLFYSRKDLVADLPMSLRMNYWVTCESAQDWAGAFDISKLPGKVEYEYIKVLQK